MLCNDFAYRGLMRFFEKISSIPRQTFHEERIASYICEFARERKLEYYCDSYNNVLVKLPATCGRECEPAILLQGHTDMVCEKSEDTYHDFLSSGLELYEENGFLRARGTTLGADNGVAVAIMLYVLDGAEGNIIAHPPIECLFTASEEVGLDGAKNFDYSRINARRMINMDSADESLIIAGCAGGTRTCLKFEPSTEIARGRALRIIVSGLAGGHSGEDIDKGRANANKLMGRILLSVGRETDIRIVSFNGGSKDNAITRRTEAVIVAERLEKIVERLHSLKTEISEELVAEDCGFSLIFEECELPAFAMNKMWSDRLIFIIATAQNGIFEMNRSVHGQVEFSRSLGIVETAEDLSAVRVTFLTRSSKSSQIRASVEQLEIYAKMLDMSVENGNSYPGWTYADSSEMRERYAEAYREIYGNDVKITTIHAGLECGIIKERLPDMDMISCGPIVLNLHSPDEAMDIASFERFFTVIKKVLTK